MDNLVVVKVDVDLDIIVRVVLVEVKLDLVEVDAIEMVLVVERIDGSMEKVEVNVSVVTERAIRFWNESAL